MIALLLALLAYTPYPPGPTTTAPDGESGTCEVRGDEWWRGHDDVEDLTLFQECWTSDTVTRLFELRLDAELLVWIHDFVEANDIESGGDDVFEVH